MFHTIIDQAEKWLRAAASHSGSKEIFWSIALIACASLAARIQFRLIHNRQDESIEQKRQARANFRNALIFATLGMLGFVWGGEIRSLILSLAAIAAAIMIVSKEVISCFYGAFLFALSKPAKIGDSIEIGTLKGELLDHNWFYMTLMEHADTHYYSGKTVKIPNSILLVSPLVNLSQGGDFRFSTLSFHARHEHATVALTAALDSANESCHAWIEQAKEHVQTLQNTHLTQAPDAQPKATLVSHDKDSVIISLRFPVPAGQRAQIQAEISKKYFERFEAHLKSEKQIERDREDQRHLARVAP